MEIVKSNNGFPWAWKAGRVEKLIRSILEDKARRQLDVDRVMIINPTWLHETNLTSDIQAANPDFIICHTFADPVITEVKQIIQATSDLFQELNLNKPENKNENQ